MDWLSSCASYFFSPNGRRLRRKGTTFLALAWASSNICLISKGNEWFPAPHMQATYSREKLHGHYMSSVRMAKKNASKKLNDLDELLESLIPIPSPADIKNADKEDRRALWNQMLHGFFARALASVYCVCVLSISHQLSWVLLGKYMYLRNLFSNSPLVVKDIELSEDEQALFSTKMNEAVTKSFTVLASRCLEAAKEVLSSVSLKQRWNADDVNGYINAIRHRIEETKEGEKPWFYNSFFPQGYVLDEKVNLLLNETKNTVHHPQFGGVMSVVIDGLFASILDQMESNVFSEQKTDPKGSIVAALLPKLKKFGDTIVSSPDFFPTSSGEEGGLGFQVQRKAADCVLMSTHLNWFLFEEVYCDIPEILAQATD